MVLQCKDIKCFRISGGGFNFINTKRRHFKRQNMAFKHQNRRLTFREFHKTFLAFVLLILAFKTLKLAFNFYEMDPWVHLCAAEYGQLVTTCSNVNLPQIRKNSITKPQNNHFEKYSKCEIQTKFK